MRNKNEFRLLLWIILGTIVFIVGLIISIAKHERSLREKRERRLLELIEAQDNQQLRQSYIRNVCYDQYGWRPLNDSLYEVKVTSLAKYLDHLIVDDINKLIYCFVPKVASTNWKRVLLAINMKPNENYNELNPLDIKGNESHVPQAFRTLNQYNDTTEITYKLRSYLKFMFVRNPYERLLSAFRNKFEDTFKDYFRERFGRKIVKQFRQQPTNESLERGHDVTFEEFLTYISQLNTSDHNHQFNEHWRPVTNLCFPCAIDYDVIGKYETLHSDVQLVLRKARINHLIQFPKREDTYSNLPSSDLISQYYTNVSDILIDKLAKVYNQDITLFQYNYDIRNKT
ncbi:carbohydrate sulfotransferase 11-like [Oppia nitens]|uniref:carbohydrate sulfotransferase 11-like n=1 Tax=Oppia nitens TaxID=1686743 RepID=UPI0023DA5137|nr:carbohydrate sulfotransferase 11-like [Oppia nitens]